VAWQLWIAQRIHAGAQLYRDIIEVNPPLWFWMALPIDRVAGLLHVRPESVLAAAMGGLVMIAIAATNALLSELSSERRTVLLVYVAVILTAMPWVHLGQREQIVLVGTVPYAALIAARRDGRAVLPLLAFLIGCGAAFGFALKHYFLLVPALLEFWLIASRRSAWRWRRPELLGMALVGGGYASALLLWAPDYLTSILPLVRLSYGMLGAHSIGDLFGPFAVLGLISLAVAAAEIFPLSRENSRFGSAMLVAALGLGIAYFLQAKGWIYHALPMLGCASLALAALLVESRPPKLLLRFAAPALLMLPFVLTIEEFRYPLLPNADLDGALSGLRAGDSVGFLAVDTAIPWSVTLQRGFRYPSRYMGDWMLNAVVNNEHQPHPDPHLVSLGRQVVSDTVGDFRCAPPRRIIIARPRAGEPGFDILPFFLRDPQFAELLSHYRQRSRTGLQTLELVAPWSQPSEGTCRAAAARTQG